MKEMNIKIGQLFDFIKDKYNVTFETDTFVETPFKLETKSEKDEWVPVKKLVVKKDDIWETELSNGTTLKTAAQHLVCTDPEKNLCKNTESLNSGDTLDYLETEVVSNKKVLEDETVYGWEIDTASHLYKTPNGVVHHNTHTVDLAVEKGREQWTPNKRHQTRPELIKSVGSVGTSFSSLLIFFYKNRNNKLLVLDDADGFLTVDNQDIQNFMKALTSGNMKPITTPLSIRNRASKDMQKESNVAQKESLIKVNTDRLAEGLCSVNVNGQNFSFNVTEEEAVQLGCHFGYKKGTHLSENKSPIQFDRFGKLVTQASFNEAEDDQLSKKIVKLRNDLLMSDDFDGPIVDESDIPEQFVFDSSIIFITNLSLTDLDSAVVSRMDTVEINLTPEEFVCRAEQILPYLKMGIYSSTSQEIIEWAKKESFAFFKIALLGNAKYSNWTVSVNRPLDFRLLETITGRFIARANNFCIKNDIDANDSNNWSTIEDGIAESFLRDLFSILRQKG